jgi:hypothetical protein
MPRPKMTMTQSHSINISNLTHNSVLSYIEPKNVLTINSKNNEKIMEIDSEGDVFFRLNGEWKKIDCENDISLMFVAVISGLTGVQYKDKNELISKIIENYRGNQIDKILK